MAEVGAALRIALSLTPGRANVANRLKLIIFCKYVILHQFCKLYIYKTCFCWYRRRPSLMHLLKWELGIEACVLQYLGIEGCVVQ